jgi:hypothetical protein
LWYGLSDNLVHMGNIEAFTLHMGEKFGWADVQPSDASNVHSILRKLGEQTAIHAPHVKMNTNTRQSWPEPEEWIVPQPTEIDK